MQDAGTGSDLGGVPDARVREVVREVLERDEFEFNDEPPWWTDMLEWLVEDIDGEGIVAAGEVVYWLVIVVLGLALGWLILRAARYGFSRPPRVAPTAESTEEVVRQRVRELRRRADRARVDGNLPLALRLSFFALVVGLGERGDLEYRDAWTNRELLERGQPGAEVRRLLAPLVEELDDKGFGHSPTRGVDVDRIERLCDKWLGAHA